MTDVAHVCRPPEAEAWWTRSQDAEDWHAEFWACDCGQWWTVDKYPCRSCGQMEPAQVTRTVDPDADFSPDPSLFPFFRWQQGNLRYDLIDRN